MSFMSNQTKFRKDFQREVTQAVKITINELKRHNITANMTVSVS